MQGHRARVRHHDHRRRHRGEGAGEAHAADRRASTSSDILLVDEGDIEQAIVLLLEIEKTVVEGAGAAGLAALLANRDALRGQAKSGSCCAAATSIR